MYVIDDRFFSNVQDIAEFLEYEFLIEQNEDFTIEAYKCDLEKIGTLDGETIVERVFDEDRFSEEGDEKKDIAKMLDLKVNWKEINALLPRMWYPSNRKLIFTKAELIAEIID